MRATGGGTMTRFRQVTSPASGLLRSLILDSVLFGNRLKPDRLLEARLRRAAAAGDASLIRSIGSYRVLLCFPEV